MKIKRKIKRVGVILFCYSFEGVYFLNAIKFKIKKSLTSSGTIEFEEKLTLVSSEPVQRCRLAGRPGVVDGDLDKIKLISFCILSDDADMVLDSELIKCG